MDDIQERTLLEAITSIDKKLKRLSERLELRESVAISGLDAKALTDYLKPRLKKYFEQKLDGRFTSYPFILTEEGFIQNLAYEILAYLKQRELETKQSESYPD